MMVTTVTRMEVRSEMAEVILNITLEIIHLLTGEDYTVVKKKSGECVTPSSCPLIPGGWAGVQKPIMEELSSQSVIHEKKKNAKILELAHKMIELLTGEVPVRCHDVSVHLSMEEWEYLEGHKDLYKDVMMEDRQSLSPPGCLSENPSSREQSSGSSSQSDPCGLSHLRHDLKQATKDVTVCDGGSLQEAVSYGPTSRAQHPSPRVMKEAVSSNGGTMTDPNTYLSVDGDKERPSAHHIEELASELYIPAHPLQYVSFPYIKEEPDSSDEDLSEANSYTPTDHSQYPSHIKEEPVSGDEDFPEPNSYIPTDHLQYASHIKEESVSSDDDLPEPNSYPYGHQYTYMKVEASPRAGGNLLHCDIYAPNDHLSSHVKEEPIACDVRSLTYSDRSIPTDCMQHPTTRIKEEAASCDVADLTHYLPTLIKEEPLSWDANAKDPLAQAEKEPISSQLGYPKETDLHSAADRPENVPSPCVKEEAADVKPEAASAPVKVIVLAHLVDIDSSKAGGTNNRHYSSQSEDCVASTSLRSKYDIKEARLSCRGHASAGKTPEGAHTFGDISNLTKYSRIHSRKKTLQCSECGQYFLRKIHLEAHVKIHAKRKCLQCSNCGNYFWDVVQLADRKKDPEETKYQCHYCRKHLNNQPNLLPREKNPKAEKPFQCSECGKCFSIYYQLFVHKKKHLEDSK